MSGLPSFEWDENKRRENIRKHGVDFLDVPLLFENPMIELIDDREDYGEIRLITLGVVGLKAYRVVYTLRNGRVRIISARRANKHEQKIYYRSIHSR